MFLKKSKLKWVMFTHSNFSTLPVLGKTYSQKYAYYPHSISVVCLKEMKISAGGINSRSSKITQTHYKKQQIQGKRKHIVP